MSFLKRLFGRGGDAETPAPASGKTLEHNGFLVRATPYKAEGQFQTCGVVSKDIDGETREHRFIRADRFASMDEAADNALRKGRQLIDEQGQRLFD